MIMLLGNAIIRSQQMIDETRAALLYSLEPVFATLIGVLAGATPLTVMFLAGASMIMAGIIISSLKFEYRKKLQAVSGDSKP